MAETIDFSKTRRVVLLIDLNPLLHLQQNPNLYVKSVLTSSRILLNFSPLASSLFAFKLFFSSLSPLRSASLLSKASPSTLSFNHSSETLTALSNTLNSLDTHHLPNSPSLASTTASSLLHLVHNYDWESEIECAPGKTENFPVIPTSLIALFSPISRSLECLSEFMSVDLSHECLRTVDVFNLKFSEVFSVVNNAFVRRNIHFSWIDVKYEMDCSGVKVGMDEAAPQLGWFENEITSMGWGLCSTDAIVLGSALIPFGLIYPNIGISFDFHNYVKYFPKSIRGQLSLEISDVSGQPLKCECCDIELLNLKLSSEVRADNTMNSSDVKYSENEQFGQEEVLCGLFDDGAVKLQIKALQRYAKDVSLTKCSSTHLLVQGFSRKSGKSGKKGSDGFFTAKVLEILSRGSGNQGHNMPIWQILMSFLYEDGYWAFVSICNSNGDSIMAILKPLTIQFALLSIIDSGHIIESNPYGVKSTKNDVEDGKWKRNKKHSHENLTWSSFHRAAFDCSFFNLADIYFTREFAESKRLKFLKCWVKQMKKSRHHQLLLTVESKFDQHIAKEKEERLTETEQENQRLEYEPCRGLEQSTCVSLSESLEVFNDIPKKIQHALWSEGVEIQTLSERLVKSSIQRLYQKHVMEDNMAHTEIKREDSLEKIVCAELIELLLREPKELNEKRKDYDPSFQAAEQSCSSEYIVREYELQILLRMEILRSQVAVNIGEPTKKKLVKQICSLLEIVQYLVEGGFHGHLNLYDYVEKIIRTRYSAVLEDVVHRIYAQMDLLPFGDEDESQDVLFNSEDSNHSWREKQERHEIAGTNKMHQSTSAEDESPQPPDDVGDGSLGISEEKHASKLSEARERRERARRFVSSRSWVPDLQRVWAPRPTKTVKSKSEFLWKESQQKERKRASCSVVCETPMTEKKCLYPRHSRKGDDDYRDHGSSSSSSVSKALFQD